MYTAKKKKTFIQFDCWEQVKNYQTFGITEENIPPSYIHQANPIVEEDEVPPTTTFEDQGFSTPESNPEVP